MSLRNLRVLSPIGVAFFLLAAAGAAHAGNTSTNTSNNQSTNTSSDAWSSNSSSNSSENSSGVRGRVRDYRRDERIDVRNRGRFMGYRYDLYEYRGHPRGAWQNRYGNRDYRVR